LRIITSIKKRVVLIILGLGQLAKKVKKSLEKAKGKTSELSKKKVDKKKDKVLDNSNSDNLSEDYTDT